MKGRIDAGDAGAAVVVIMLLAILLVCAVHAWDTECDIREAKATRIVSGLAR